MSGNSGRSGATQIEVAAEYDGQRLDNFLLRELGKVPRSLVYRLLRKGEVRVNKGRKKPDYRLAAGDIVRLPPQQALDARRPAADAVSDSLRACLDNAVMFEDERLIALNKPAGVPVHAGSGIATGLIEALRVMRGSASLELVHRLDRGTSGCLLVARNRKRLLPLQDAFRQRLTSKVYLALVQGQFPATTVTVTEPLRRFTLPNGERRVEVHPEGREACSHFRRLQQFGACALVEVTIETGRTHQIRVHAAHLGHALIGDDKYGDRTALRRLNLSGPARLYLHAASLRLDCDPPVQLQAPPDSRWQQAMATLAARTGNKPA
ncbi:RluA family pseudouridine synthase [Granulosicoccaceae sp. 1_MG-2023]|nr:RluA family pseudouridine synthase [Granulosicoccaceae sp. 1_MG-2023]